MMAERGDSVAPSTIVHWVQHYAPEFEKRWNRFARPVGGSWRVVDFRLSRKRDVAAAKAFFRNAFKKHGRVPRTITLDGYQASHRAVRELGVEDRKLRTVTVRSCQYLNNIVEQDQRGVKQRLRPMLGLKNFGQAAIMRSRSPASSCCMTQQR
jgi:transposase-like protein